MGLTGCGQMCIGRLQVQLLSRTPCWFSLTAWTGWYISDFMHTFPFVQLTCFDTRFCFSFHSALILQYVNLSMINLAPSCCSGLEELGSVALQMSTEGDGTSERASQYSLHVMTAIENTRSPLTVFGVCHMDDWLAHPSCGKVLMLREVRHPSLLLSLHIRLDQSSRKLSRNLGNSLKAWLDSSWWGFCNLLRKCSRRNTVNISHFYHFCQMLNVNFSIDPPGRTALRRFASRYYK